MYCVNNRIVESSKSLVPCPPKEELRTSIYLIIEVAFSVEDFNLNRNPLLPTLPLGKGFSGDTKLKTSLWDGLHTGQCS